MNTLSTKKGSNTLKQITTKQILPLVTMAFATLFMTIGFTKLGFWDNVNGPESGFFPCIVGIVMILTSIIAFVQSFREGAPNYQFQDYWPLLGVLGIVLSAFIIGLVVAAILFVPVWLKVVEKEGWKNTLIVTAVMVAIVLGVFVFWLRVPFPVGLIGEWIGGVF
ncbi:hypothetical protein SDC9_156488 [bioreactor metagenome]|uniref:DUF1468 domain-containing protein n=1 Tax=bioreactor metagenome TaxID=1076179 RepID=A0A645F776_9ZZZZ